MAFGPLDNAVADVGGAISSAAGVLNTLTHGDIPGLGPNPAGSAPNSAVDLYVSQIGDTNSGPVLWQTEGADWYKLFGYRFSIAYLPSVTAPGVSIDDALSGGAATVQYLHFTLPIPPSNIMTKPMMASRATATLGGVVEETSAVKFWMTNMSGTTGTSVSRAASDQNARESLASKFRDVIGTTGGLASRFLDAQRRLSQLGGQIDTAVNTISQTNAAFTQAAATGDPLAGLAAFGNAFGAGFDLITGAVEQALVPPIPFAGSAVDRTTNGYTEAQELQKFFYIYAALKAKNPKKYALMYSDFKTDQSWRCIVKDFQLQRNAENPFLWRYNIALQCWNIRKAKAIFSGNGTGEVDRFAFGGDLHGVNTLSTAQLPSPLATSALFSAFEPSRG